MTTRHLVDPELLAMLEAFPTIELSRELLPELRAAERSMVLPVEVDPAAAAAIEHASRKIPGPAGAPDVGVEIYRPLSAAGDLPCIFHIHGGGYVGGFAALLRPLHVPLAHELGCAIVSVDYRLAPETPFPGPLEDCYAALAWLQENAAELGVDPLRIGVMGESAGGGLAAALALLARDRSGPTLCFQHLIYPMLDDRTCIREDRNPHTGEFIWTPHNNTFGWAALLGAPPGSDGISPYAAAARAEDLSGLPPAFVSTAALDLFLEEDLDYARRLARHGVPIELHVYPGAFHGFDLAPEARISRIARRDSLEALRRALRPETAP